MILTFGQYYWYWHNPNFLFRFNISKLRSNRELIYEQFMAKATPHFWIQFFIKSINSFRNSMVLWKKLDHLFYFYFVYCLWEISIYWLSSYQLPTLTKTLSMILVKKQKLCQNYWLFNEYLLTHVPPNTVIDIPWAYRIYFFNLADCS